MTLTWRRFAALSLLTALPLLLLPTLPNQHTVGLMALASVVLIWRCGVGCRLVGYAGLLLSWHLHSATQLVSDIERYGGRRVTADIRIETWLAEKQIARIQLIAINQQAVFPPRYARVYWPTLAQSTTMPCAGQYWKIKLKLQPVHALLNVGGFDRQRFMLASSTIFTGQVRQQQPIDQRCHWRQRFIASVDQHLEKLPMRAILRALAFGERGDIGRETQDLLRVTGTAHLMAISGMHIGLAAAAGYWLARLLQILLPTHWIGWRWPLIASLAVATLYTLLSGVNLPAQRALLALLLWRALRWHHRHQHSLDIWLIVVGLLLFLDPLSVLAESFWLSTLAVLILLCWYHLFPLPSQLRGVCWLPARLLHLQVGMLLLMLPLQTLLFEGVGLGALLANLIAIPVITLVTLPLILLALLLPIGSVSAWLWLLADTSLALLFTTLEKLPSLWLPLYQPGFWAISMWGGIVTKFLFGWRNTLLALSGFLFIFICRREIDDDSTWRITLLDVGHGLAVVIAKQGEALLYDTGGKWPTTDAGERIIVPWLLRNHLDVTQIILSHPHLDHTGGLASVTKAFPHAVIRSNFGANKPLSCTRGDHWQWQGLDFSVLWPLPNHYPLGNDSSCVVRVTDGKISLLLTGDLERAGKRRLVSLSRASLPSTLLQVPHHGSKSSSTPLFLRNVKGQAALASVARYNAWRLPAQTTIDQYRQAGYQWYSTARSGELQVTIKAGQWRVAGYREALVPRWYHRWFGVYSESG